MRDELDMDSGVLGQIVDTCWDADIKGIHLICSSQSKERVLGRSGRFLGLADWESRCCRW